MDCTVAREALSARVDGEREPVPALRVDEHLASCSDCRDWHAQIVDQTQLLRRLAGRSHVTPVPAADTSRHTDRRHRLGSLAWHRIALAAVGALQIAVAAAQALGADMGMPTSGHAVMAEHLTNESTAWSLALGVVMIVAAVRPTVSAGLAGVLSVFTGVLAIYVISDAIAGTVTLLRILSHLPVLAGMVLAVLVWRTSRPAGPEPRAGTQDPPGQLPGDADEIVLPPRASRGRRRHLYPTDGSAA